MTELAFNVNLNRHIDPWWRKARIAARLVLKNDHGVRWTERDRRLAEMLSADPGVTNRLIYQASASLEARKRNGHSILDIID